MLKLLLLVGTLSALPSEPVRPGDVTRSVEVQGQSRRYLLHVPPSFDPQRPMPVVLALHPFATNGPMMATISGLSATADRHGFVVVYPNGTGRAGVLRWNVGLWDGDSVDDVGYLIRVLDDLETIVRVDRQRVFATGFSNGAMMCYRLASEHADRIAAIAPVGGTMASPRIAATRPVSVLHFHGTKDTFVSYDGRSRGAPGAERLLGAEASVAAWARHNGCPEPATLTPLARTADDGLSIERLAYSPGREGAEVVLYKVVGGGHVWPGQRPIGLFLGKSPLDLDANERIWSFFSRHPMP